MGLKDVKAGEKVGKAIGARFIKSKEKGTPGIEVMFEFEEPSTGSQERLSWVGWVSSGAAENTMNTLVNVLGSNGNDSVDANGTFTDPEFLDYKREVKLVIEMDEFTDQKTGEVKYYPKIKWVNRIGGSGFASVSPEVVKNELKAIGFKGLFLSAKQGAKSSQEPSKQPVDSKKLPF